VCNFLSHVKKSVLVWGVSVMAGEEEEEEE